MFVNSFIAVFWEHKRTNLTFNLCQMPSCSSIITAFLRASNARALKQPQPPTESVDSLSTQFPRIEFTADDITKELHLFHNLLPVMARSKFVQWMR